MPEVNIEKHKLTVLVVNLLSQERCQEITSFQTNKWLG